MIPFFKRTSSNFLSSVQALVPTMRKNDSRQTLYMILNFRISGCKIDVLQAGVGFRLNICPAFDRKVSHRSGAGCRGILTRDDAQFAGHNQ
jgi:hypothetical protein